MVNFDKLLNKDLYLYYEIEYYINRMLKSYPYAPIAITTYQNKGIIKFYCYPKVPKIIFNIIRKNFTLHYWQNTPRRTNFKIRLENYRPTDKDHFKHN